MPNFIDELTVKYLFEVYINNLFKYALKDIELTNLKTEFTDFKEKAKYKNLNKQSIFKTFIKVSK